MIGGGIGEGNGACVGTGSGVGSGVGIAVGINVTAPRPDPTAFAAQVVAALSKEGSGVSVVALYNTQTGQIRLTGLSGQTVADKDYELWAIEGANAPTTPAGDRVFNERGVEVIPAILANSGGVTVSYFEWVQNKSNVSWDAEEVDQALNRHMVTAATKTKLMRKKYNCDMRTAAYIAALENIGKVYALRGIFP